MERRTMTRKRTKRKKKTRLDHSASKRFPHFLSISFPFFSHFLSLGSLCDQDDVLFLPEKSHDILKWPRNKSVFKHQFPLYKLCTYLCLFCINCFFSVVQFIQLIKLFHGGIKSSPLILLQKRNLWQSCS